MGTQRETELDGLRAIAALMVVGRHASAPGFSGGGIGVDLFFVLSGLLITGILLREQDQTGAIDIGAFIRRRLRRLAPALGLLVAAFLLAAPIIFPGQGWREALAALLYISDLTKAFSNGTFGGALGHTWSLAVEMQFYLLWPLVLATPRRALPTVLGALFVLETLWRAHQAVNHGWFAAYTRPDTHSTGLILGSLLAATRLEGRPWCAWAGLAGVLALCVALPAKGAPTLVWGVTSAEVCSALLLLGVRAGGLRAVFTHPLAVWLGAISYGVYLWHYPAAEALRGYGWPIALFGALAIGVGGGALSYYTIEAPGRRWRAAARPA